MNLVSRPAAARRSAGFQTCRIAGLQACRALGRTGVLRNVARRSRLECLRYGVKVGSWIVNGPLIRGAKQPRTEVARHPADIWNILHDGEVLGVSGTVPGEVQFSVRIDYLRNRFPEPGNRILLTLHGCTSLSYEPHGEEAELTNLATIAEAEPTILQAKDWTDASIVYCASGIVSVSAAEFSLLLDSGRTVPFDELCSVSEAYWTAFGGRSQK